MSLFFPTICPVSAWLEVGLALKQTDTRDKRRRRKRIGLSGFEHTIWVHAWVRSDLKSLRRPETGNFIGVLF